MVRFEPLQLDNFQVDLVDVHLVHARYLDTEEPRHEPRTLSEEVPIGLQMAFDRPASDELTIALTVRIEVERPYRIEVTYAGHFVMSAEVEEANRDVTWRRTATELAPIVLYPYIRELVTSLTRRGRAEPFVLPILSFAGLRNEEITIPPAPHADQLSLEAQDRKAL